MPMQQLYIWFFSGCLLCNPNSASGLNSIDILKRVFPKSKVCTYPAGKLGGEGVKILSPVYLRGLKGGVPIEAARLVSISDQLVSVAFPIYLTGGLWSDSLLIKRPLSNPGGSLKLIQVISYDIKLNKFLGKPVGYPLQCKSWSCTGDFCDTRSIISYEIISKCPTITLLRYSESVDNHLMQAHCFNREVVVSSKPVLFGDMGGQTGFDVSAKYSSFRIQGDSLTAERKSVCVARGSTFCTSVSLLRPREY